MDPMQRPPVFVSKKAVGFGTLPVVPAKRKACDTASASAEYKQLISECGAVLAVVIKTGKYFSSKIVYVRNELLILTSNIFFGCYLMSNISILEIFLLNVLERLAFSIFKIINPHQREKRYRSV